MLKRWLEHPLTRGMHPDDPATTQLRRTIINEKTFLRHIYMEWYTSIATHMPASGTILELGSGAGFLPSIMPHSSVFTSDVFHLPGLDLVCDGCRLPFADACLDGIAMVDVLHHIPDVERFFTEVQRTLRPGGRMVMIEPWNTPWSQYIYTHLHHEPFDAEISTWAFPSSGPLSGANGALPWIVFERDRTLFETRYPSLHIFQVVLDMPGCYLLSGGVSLRTLMPGWSFGMVRRIEHLLRPWIKKLAMFACIVVEKEAV